MSKKKAFTLVELLVVIAIIAILAVAGVVGYTVFTEKARKSNAESELSQVKTLIQAEDFSNNYFEIASGTMTFGFKCATAVTIGTTEYAVGDWVTKDVYDDFSVSDKENFVSLTIKDIAEESEDTELKAVADKLSNDGSSITMTSTSNSKYEAVWNIVKDTITGQKKS